MDLATITILIEIPFFLVAVWFAISAARKMYGGRFGTGMTSLAIAMTLMAIAHFHLLFDRLTGIFLFHTIFGQILGTIFLGVYLVVMWWLFIRGFQKFIKVSE